MTQPAGSTSPLRKWLPIFVSVLVMIVIFGFVLPQYIDYGAVFRAIGNISFVDWLVLGLLAVVQFVPDAWTLQASLPGATLRQGVTISTVTMAVANVPPGGLEVIVRYHMTRGWGFTARAATASTILTWIFATTSKLLMPVIAFLLLSLNRIRDEDVDFLAGLGLLLVLAGGLLIAFGLRSRRFIAFVARMLTWLVNRIGRLFRRDWALDLENAMLQFRDQTSDVLRSRWHLGVLGGLSVQLMAFVIMLTAVRGVGLTPEVLSTLAVFAAVAVVAAVTTIPIFNAPGLNEAVYIAILGFASGGGQADEVAAAVFVFRLITWLVPIPIGGLSYSRWRAATTAADSTLESPE